MSNPDRGRPFSDVWEYMIKGQQQSRRHYTATCTYCNYVALYFARIVGQKMGEDEDDENDSNSDSEVPKKKQKYSNQTSLSNFYKTKKLEKGYSDSIDRSITKAFVMCNIPFSTIENPWFVDLMKTLQPGYDLPSRHTLSGTYLEAELSRVNIRIVNELNNESNLTIALDGWTDPRGNSLWAFMLLTGSRKEYLWSLEDLSSTKHTGQHIANVIDEVLDNHEISSDNVKSILKKRGFFDDMRVLSDILKPIKESILVLEGTKTNLADCYLQLLKMAANVKSMPIDDYKTLKNSCIRIFNRRFAEYDEDIYLLAFFLHPYYKGLGVRNQQFDRIQKAALRLWKALGHKKASGLELHSQIRSYFDNAKPYDAQYSPEHDVPYLWWNSIIDGKFSSLSRFSKVIFSITPHSASCERLFSSLGWMFGKKRTNLSAQTIESMAKIYRYNLSTKGQKSLNHADLISNNDVQQMLNNVFEEGDLFNESDDDEELIPNEGNEVETSDVDEILDIENVVDLGPWVLIDNTTLPIVTRRRCNSDDEDDEDWNPDEI
ncbi:unnamed protein product [Rhizophagus irregularis]|nr:unnamed protein product [Rhizophagus irregularis]